MKNYRNDIDGLRAYAVIAVIIFHLGFMKNGYLGVDIFFVISGYLITNIIYKGINEKKFSIKKFYVKRIRRIIPLLLFISSIALIIGLFLMLPDDLENLAQSVVASNFSVNNILMLITSSDYWATQNEYKPLMHTWSLGIEEQYYLIYPFALLIVSKIKVNYIKYLLLFTSLISIYLFLFQGNEASKFYLLHYRFFELSVGGLAAISFYDFHKDKNIMKYIFYLSFLLLIVLLVIPYHNNQVLVISTTIFSVVLLTTGKFTYQNNKISKYLLQNKILIYIGKISFSLYLWHQLIFSFSRYAFFETLGFKESIFLILVTFILSVFTYHLIENPFRNSKKISTKKVLVILSVVFLVFTSSALYVYFIGGIYKDYPSLGIIEKKINLNKLNLFSSTDNIHISYNEDVRKLDKDFDNLNQKPKILIIGNSFGRDVVNIFNESNISNKIELSYFDINRVDTDENIINRWNNADLVVFSAKKFKAQSWFQIIENNFYSKIDFNKLICFGTKDFGYSNGIHYNKLSTISDFTDYYVKMKDGILQIENELSIEWKDKYISLIKPLSNDDGKIRIFTNDGLFLSQDTIHLTKAGAVFYAILFDEELINIYNNLRKK